VTAPRETGLGVPVNGKPGRLLGVSFTLQLLSALWDGEDKGGWRYSITGKRVSRAPRGKQVSRLIRRHQPDHEAGPRLALESLRPKLTCTGGGELVISAAGA
jgi:hypothetical protein